jgi:hypothetical protein
MLVASVNHLQVTKTGGLFGMDVLAHILHELCLQYICRRAWSVALLSTLLKLRSHCSYITVFALPFSLLSKLQVEGRDKLALVSIFLLGAVTIVISILRFSRVTLEVDVDVLGMKVFTLIQAHLSIVRL